MKRGIFGFLFKLYKVIVIFMISAMFIIVGINVFSRYVLNNSLGWADELARFIFIWVSFLGAVLAYNENEFVGLDFVLNIFSARVKNLIKVITDLLVLLVVVFLTYYGCIVATSATNVSPALYIPMKTVYMIVPFSAGLMVLINFKKTFTDIKLVFINKKTENREV